MSSVIEELNNVATALGSDAEATNVTGGIKNITNALAGSDVAEATSISSAINEMIPYVGQGSGGEEIYSMESLPMVARYIRNGLNSIPDDPEQFIIGALESEDSITFSSIFFEFNGMYTKQNHCILSFGAPEPLIGNTLSFIQMPDKDKYGNPILSWWEDVYIIKNSSDNYEVINKIKMDDLVDQDGLYHVPQLMPPITIENEDDYGNLFPYEVFVVFGATVNQQLS